MSEGEGNPMRAFGVKSNHTNGLKIVPTPDGNCCWCDESIGKNDKGVIMDSWGPDGVVDAYWHYECLLRNILGSVGHQRKKCSCFGGEGNGDPPEMTKREAAKAAVDEFKKRENL